jgi:hypothetical protein
MPPFFWRLVVHFGSSVKNAAGARIFLAFEVCPREDFSVSDRVGATPFQGVAETPVGSCVVAAPDSLRQRVPVSARRRRRAQIRRSIDLNRRWVR